MQHSSTQLSGHGDNDRRRHSEQVVRTILRTKKSPKIFPKTNPRALKRPRKVPRAFPQSSMNPPKTRKGFQLLFMAAKTSSQREKHVSVTYGSIVIYYLCYINRKILRKILRERLFLRIQKNCILTSKKYRKHLEISVKFTIFVVIKKLYFA